YAICQMLLSSAWHEGLPLLETFIRKLPVFRAFHHPLEIMLFGSELADRRGSMGRDEHSLLLLGDDLNRDMAKASLRHLAFKVIQQLEMLVRHLQHEALHSLTR